jgi:class 3 adenylate cyclase
MDSETEGPFRSRDLVIVVVDVRGYDRACQRNSDEVMAHFIDRYYRTAHALITGRGGTLIKFMGDG